MKSTLRNLLEDAILDRCSELVSKPKKIFGREYRFTYGNVGWWEYLRCLGENYAIDGEWNIWKYVKEYKAWLSHSFEDATEFPVVDLTKSVLEQSDEILQKLVDLIPNK